MNKVDRFIDAVTGLIDAKKTEIIFNMTLAAIGAGLTLLTAAWVVHQIRMMWGI